MGIHIAWDNDEHTIFRYTFESRWTWDQFFAAKDQARPLLDACPHPFAVVIDISPVTRLPANSLANSRKALRSGHPRAAMIILVTPSPVLRTMVRALRDVAPISPRAVDVVATLDEARALVRERLQRPITDP
jgi:hypothetical protein